MKKILAFVGEIASGKGAASDYILEHHTAGYYRFSNILKDLIKRLYLENTRDNLITISELIRSHFGEDVLAKVMAEDVKNDPNDLVIVDGVRRMADIEYLQKLEGFKLVYITADQNIRYERAKNRGEKTDELNLTFEQFLANEQRSTEKSIAEVATHADITITNNGSLEELFQAIEKLL